MRQVKLKKKKKKSTPWTRIILSNLTVLSEKPTTSMPPAATMALKMPVSCSCSGV
jgi:hypothetical protein